MINSGEVITTLFTFSLSLFALVVAVCNYVNVSRPSIDYVAPTRWWHLRHWYRELKLWYTVRKDNKVFRLRQKQLKKEGKATWK